MRKSYEILWKSQEFYGNLEEISGKPGRRAILGVVSGEPCTHGRLLEALGGGDEQGTSVGSRFGTKAYVFTRLSINLYVYTLYLEPVGHLISKGNAWSYHIDSCEIGVKRALRAPAEQFFSDQLQALRHHGARGERFIDKEAIRKLDPRPTWRL